jgi:hypothetical protein
VGEQFEPRTVGIVALSSLLGGFVVVFGGGMLALRSPRRLAPAPPEPAVTVADADPVRAPAPVAPVTPAPATGDAEPPTPVPNDNDSGAVTTATGVTVSPVTISRCFAGMAPTPVTGAQCGALAALDAHFAAKATDIAACGRGHGALAFVMDFSFSTSFVRAWGGPSSTIPDAGAVAACVRRVTAPLPLAQVPHAYDRYVVTVPILWP